MPSIVPCTGNHCDKMVGDTEYVSIVVVLNPYLADGHAEPAIPPGGIADKFDQGLIDSSAVASDRMRMLGRVFSWHGPTTFDPVIHHVRAHDRLFCLGRHFRTGVGKIGTLCMNATATFNVSGATMSTTDPNDYDPTSKISANGSSNCVTIMRPAQ